MPEGPPTIPSIFKVCTSRPDLPGGRFTGGITPPVVSLFTRIEKGSLRAAEAPGFSTGKMAGVAGAGAAARGEGFGWRAGAGAGFGAGIAIGLCTVRAPVCAAAFAVAGFVWAISGRVTGKEQAAPSTAMAAYRVCFNVTRRMDLFTFNASPAPEVFFLASWEQEHRHCS